MLFCDSSKINFDLSILVKCLLKLEYGLTPLQGLLRRSAGPPLRKGSAKREAPFRCVAHAPPPFPKGLVCSFPQGGGAWER